MIRVDAASHISRGIFVYEEIMQMHTIHEKNYKVIKEPRNGNSKASNKLTKTNWLIWVIKHN